MLRKICVAVAWLLITLPLAACSGSSNSARDTDLNAEQNDSVPVQTSTTANEPETGQSAPGRQLLNYAGTDYALQHAVLDHRGQSQNHNIAEVLISDGIPFQALFQSLHRASAADSISAWLWDVADARVWLRLELNSPLHASGTSGIDNGSYRSIGSGEDVNSESLSNVAFFNAASLGIDLDQSGNIDASAGEIFDVNLGSIDISLSNRDANVNFTLVLENGINVTGLYQGVIEQHAP